MLKVWGGSLDGMRRTIVCAPTKKRAVELLRSNGPILSMHYFNDYWSETGNCEELAVATTEGVWTADDMWGAAFVKVR